MDSFGIQDIIVSLSKLHNLFDIIRVIDPVNKRVLHYDDDDDDEGPAY